MKKDLQAAIDQIVSLVEVKNFVCDIIGDQCIENFKRICANYNVFKIISSQLHNDNYDMMQAKLFEEQLANVNVVWVFAKVDEYIRKQYGPSSSFLKKIDELDKEACETLQNDSAMLDEIYTMIKNNYDETRENIQDILQRIRFHQIALRATIVNVKIKSGEVPMDKFCEYVNSMSFKD